MMEIIDHSLMNLFYVLKAFGNGLVFGVLPFIVVLTCILPLRFFLSDDTKRDFPKIAAFACIGVFLGMFTGASRAPVVAAMLPAMITLISGVTVYFFERKSEQRADFSLAAIAPMLCALVICAAFGAHQASYLRVLSLMAEQEVSLNADISKAENTELKLVLDRAELCRKKFADDAEMKTACVGLLKK